MDPVFIVIPTYWTWPAGASSLPELASFDHPTPLDGESTLPRLLDDLCQQQAPNFRTLILTGLAHPNLSQPVTERLRFLLAPYQRRLLLEVCDGPGWQRLKNALEKNGLPTEGINLYSYAGIRNLQLLIPHVLNARVIVALDDDESVEPDYLDKAQAYIGQIFDSETVLGLAGPYLQPDGSVLLNVPERTGNLLRDKAYFINRAMQALMNAPLSLHPSPMALGGNMVFHKACFSRVPFDPGITRGEDIDYLINARLQEIKWWFDPRLTILHLPPKHYETPIYQRMREDVIRFIYEREKLRSHSILNAEWLDPYPGALLNEDFNDHALAALEAEKNPEMVARFGEPGEIIQQAKEHAAQRLVQFQRFVQNWVNLMTRIEKEKNLRDELATVIRPDSK